MGDENIEILNKSEEERAASHKKHVISSIVCGVASVIIMVAIVAICLAFGLNKSDENVNVKGVEILNYFNTFYN